MSVLTITDTQERVMNLVQSVKDYAYSKMHTNQRWDILAYGCTDHDIYVAIMKCSSETGAHNKAWQTFCRSAWSMDNAAKGKTPKFYITLNGFIPGERWKLFSHHYGNVCIVFDTIDQCHEYVLATAPSELGVVLKIEEPVSL